MFQVKEFGEVAVLIGAVILVLLIGTVVAWRLAKADQPTPIDYAILDLSPAVNADFIDTNDQGNFGELLTSILVTQDSWKQLPSKYNATQGVDGLFVRELNDGGAEVLIIETKTNQGSLNETSHGRQMSDEWVIYALDQVYLVGELPEVLTTAIVEGLKANSPFIRKELWHHDLATGITSVYALDAAANKTIQRTIPSDLNDADERRLHYRFMEGVVYGLDNFDRQSSYIRLKKRLP